MPTLPTLPIDSLLPQIATSLEDHSCLVLQAAPGAGKTSRVPPLFLKSRFRNDGEILVIEPRRLAAKMAALRVAQEMGEPPGKTVGYHFRFESVSSAQTKIRFLTEGLFLRRLLSDPSLDKVAIVIIDEFHERHLQGDTALAVLRALQKKSRPDLRILVMSATLDAQAVANYLDCPTLSAEGRTFPVNIEYRPSTLNDINLERQVLSALQENTQESGDTLVFLPGIAEIRRCQEKISDFAKQRKFDLALLYGDLSREEQDRVVNPGPRPKIILSTNIAETSLTIEGITTVIDSGLARIPFYSWWSGIPSLQTRSISKASAIQRAGRAGRVRPGICVRLYSKESFDTRPAFETPEILRADLSQTLLELYSLGIESLSDIIWFEPPPAQALTAAETLLVRLGALIKKSGTTELLQLTGIGRKMALLPTHPRLSRMILEGERLGIPHEACSLAALLGENRTLPNDELDLYSKFGKFRPEGTSLKARDQLLKTLIKANTSLPSKSYTDDALGKALLAGFPDRVAKRRDLQSHVSRNTQGKMTELHLSGGGTVLVDEGRLPSGDYFITLDIEERKTTGLNMGAVRVRLLCPIEADWLLDVEPSAIIENEECLWDNTGQRVQSISRLYYGDLILSESNGVASDEKIAEVLAREANALGWQHFCNEGEARNLLARVAFARKHMPELQIPELTEESIKIALAQACLGYKSFKELRNIELLPYVRTLLPSDFEQKLHKLAPEAVTLTGGKRVPIHYEFGKDPWIESRLQDFFGMKQGPRLLEGRISLVLHLLAPNYRAVQVTSDLEGFWQRIYPDLRRELGRRYPRHSWPENPLVATPAFVPRKPRV